MSPDDAIKEGASDGRRHVWVAERNKKCAYLEKRSTTVRITDLPPTLDSLSMKSMEMSTHTWDGTARGCSSPAGGNVCVLLCWHVAQTGPVRDQGPIAQNE